MKNQLKRVLSVILSLTFITAILPLSIAASVDGSSNDEAPIQAAISATDIIAQYQSQIQTARIDPPLKSRSANSVNSSAKTQATSQLASLGYEVYDINSSNYSQKENELNTSFEDLGLSPDFSYLVILGEGNEGNGKTSRLGGTTSSYTFAYNGITYTMRSLIVTADNDPAYGKASSVDLLKSTGQTVLENCLDTAIYAAVGSIPLVGDILGTVGSICGLSVSMFNTSQQSTLRLNAGSSWTRLYTQVYDTSSQLWLNCSMVEFVTTLSFMSGTYYKASINAYDPVPTSKSTATRKSEHYDDTNWRRVQAVSGYLTNMVRGEGIDKIKYYYGSSLKITHSCPA